MDTESKTEKRIKNKEQRTKSKEQRAVIFYITDAGHGLAGRIMGLCPDAEILKFNTSVFSLKKGLKIFLFILFGSFNLFILLIL